MKIYDPYGRPIENLRIIVTTHCNFNCIFCHAEGYYDYHFFGFEANGANFSFRQKELSPQDVKLIGKVAKMFGISKVKITSGEPLLKHDIIEIVAVLKDIGFEDISLVTNGLFLAEKAYDLKRAGLNRVNVSLVSLKQEKFTAITRISSHIEKIIEGIRIAKEVGLSPIKVNMVVLRGYNEDEIEDFINFVEKHGLILQLIEYHAPPTNESALQSFYVSLEDIEKKLEKRAKRVIVRKMHARKQYVLESGAVIEVVRPMNNPNFCANCIRIRATPVGWKPCLLRDEIINYEKELAEGDIRGLAKKFLEAIYYRKPFFT